MNFYFSNIYSTPRSDFDFEPVRYSQICLSLTVASNFKFQNSNFEIFEKQKMKHLKREQHLIWLHLARFAYDVAIVFLTVDFEFFRFFFGQTRVRFASQLQSFFTRSTSSKETFEHPWTVRQSAICKPCLVNTVYTLTTRTVGSAQIWKLLKIDSLR